jgi:hypothetical protein
VSGNKVQTNEKERLNSDRVKPRAGHVDFYTE